jgi:hypothetical protein
VRRDYFIHSYRHIDLILLLGISVRNKNSIVLKYNSCRPHNRCTGGRAGGQAGRPPIRRAPGIGSAGERRPWRKADLSPQPSAEVKNEWNCTYTPQILLNGVVLNLAVDTSSWPGT